MSCTIASKAKLIVIEEEIVSINNNFLAQSIPVYILPSLVASF